VQPGGWDGIDFQGIERDRTNHTVEICGKQRIKELPQPVIMERGARQARLKSGEHPTFLQSCPSLIEGMMAIEHRQEQGFYATATGEDIRGVRRAIGIDEGSYIELADHPQHQRQVGHGTDLMNGNGHEAPLLQGF
jgi:hypothetical protein